MDFDLSRMARSIRSLTTNSAVNPLLWLVGLFAIPAMIVAASSDDVWLQVSLIVLIGLVVIAPIIGYFFFALSDPRRLHSEHYQLKSEALEIVSKGGKRVTLDAVASIANPEVKSLPGTSGDNDE
ncbi:MAG: hypothetical protein Q8S09_06010 [Hyphomonas sp.]|nr:hypothetical protein [Hyphomonas sp.]